MSEDSREKSWSIYVKISFGILLLFGVSAIVFAIYAVVQYIQSFETFFPVMEAQVPVDTSQGSIVVKQAESVSDLRGQFGTLGDVIGGLLNPVLTFATFIVLIATILIQLKELRLTRQELKNSNKMLEMSQKEQAKTALALEEQSRTQRKQQFESTFFSLLDIFNGRIKESERVLNEFFGFSNDDVTANHIYWLKSRRDLCEPSDLEYVVHSTDYFFDMLALIQELGCYDEERFYSDILVNSSGRLLITFVFILVADDTNHSRLRRSAILNDMYRFDDYCVFRNIDLSLFVASLSNYDSVRDFLDGKCNTFVIGGVDIDLNEASIEDVDKVRLRIYDFNKWVLSSVLSIGGKAFFGNFKLVEQFESIRLLNYRRNLDDL